MGEESLSGVVILLLLLIFCIIFIVFFYLSYSLTIKRGTIVRDIKKESKMVINLK